MTRKRAAVVLLLPLGIAIIVMVFLLPSMSLNLWKNRLGYEVYTSSRAFPGQLILQLNFIGSILGGTGSISVESLEAEGEGPISIENQHQFQSEFDGKLDMFYLEIPLGEQEPLEQRWEVVGTVLYSFGPEQKSERYPFRLTVSSEIPETRTAFARQRLLPQP